jgi:hypothetical protein
MHSELRSPVTHLLLVDATQTHAKEDPWPKNSSLLSAILVLAPRANVATLAQKALHVLLVVARVLMGQPFQTLAARTLHSVQMVSWMILQVAQKEF